MNFLRRASFAATLGVPIAACTLHGAEPTEPDETSESVVGGRAETRYPAVGLPSHDRASLGGSAGSSVGQAPAGMRRGIELLHGVDMEVTVEIGRTRMTVRDLLDLSPGAVLELDRAAGSPADLLVNGRLIARGEVVVVDEDYALKITELVSSTLPDNA